jgi:hypothetical protein
MNTILSQWSSKVNAFKCFLAGVQIMPKVELCTTGSYIYSSLKYLFDNLFGIPVVVCMSESVCLSIYLSIYLSVCLSTPPSIYPSIYLWLYSPLLGLCPFFSFLTFYTVRRTHWTRDQPDARPLPTHRTQAQNKRTQTSMPRVKFEPRIPVFERVRPLSSAYEWNCIRFYRRTVKYSLRRYDAPTEKRTSPLQSLHAPPHNSMEQSPWKFGSCWANQEMEHVH